jgi:hypothetical protein
MSNATTYTITVTFTVDDRTDAQLRTERAIRDEVRSWLESLNATVHDVHVTTNTPKERDK